EQELMVVRYHQQVTRISDASGIHDEIGYWIWNKADNSVVLSLSIPRGLTLLANTEKLDYSDSDLNLRVVSVAGAEHWGIVQSPFMSEKAKTVRFERELSVNGNSLTYKQLMVLEIYGKTFDHTDENTLQKQK
ncbi:heme-binding beta-barrel domain-containing protein, partial [Fibrobacterales bacterium]|nr:heme-binding beta-barrel domain-containing protein [Fibrobacterales bacterium]